VGDAEAAVRRAFALARRSPPALLFFDEIDALVCDRGAGGGASGSVRSLLVELSVLLRPLVTAPAAPAPAVVSSCPFCA
jgi:SpoVK/Ycf46/Vps4 family AAA+-type ATPase